MYVVSFTRLVAALGMAVSLGAVAEDRVPEPNEANCSGETYEQILASLAKEWDRNEFIANCKSFHAAREMTQWKFKKSPPDDF
ncbi:entry exclusion lipoprotein TrbK [Pseudomonas sp. NPDC090592]|uniref:entry exclusion lipoprotein TrbK n=1 Tax=Pseudomonas sp. NPDC090592 TaxID=3364480 RepID=UPI00383A522A